MREFKFQYKNKYHIGRDYTLIFYKLNNRGLYSIKIKDGNYILDDDYTHLILSNFLGFKDCNELYSHLKNNFQHEKTWLCRICFPLSECDKVIEWMESIAVINKLTK